MIIDRCEEKAARLLNLADESAHSVYTVTNSGQRLVAYCLICKNRLGYSGNKVEIEGEHQCIF